MGTHIGLKDYDELDERLARECHGFVPSLIRVAVMASHADRCVLRHLPTSMSSSMGLALLSDTSVEHSRYVYRLQEAAGNTTSESSDEEEHSSSESGLFQGRRSQKRMSIITNQYQDAQVRQRGKEFGKEFVEMVNNPHPSGPRKEVPQKRRFFQSGARWDGLVERVMVMHREIGVPGPLQVPPLPPINNGSRKPRNGEGGLGGVGGSGENGYGSGQWVEDSEDDDGEYRFEDEDNQVDEDREDPTPDRDANGQPVAPSTRRKKTMYY